MAASVACARCGAAVPDGARFCPACGAPQADVPREERRVVTVIFGDVSGFVELAEARDAEEVGSIVDRAFERCAQIVADYGGRVDKVIGDEIMAVFGAPQAHEDDPERAVRAALRIQEALAGMSAELEGERGFPLRMHVGVNTGEVVAGFVGGSDSYTVLGDAVNTARRIEDLAEPGQVLVGAQTHEASKDAISYRRVGTVTAKGKRLPFVVYEAVAEKGLPGERGPRAAPLVGREEELTVLGAMAGMVRRDGRPMVATLVGDAGMGKSRLAAEFARRIAAQGARVVNGRSLPYGTTSPAFPVEEIVRDALRIPQDDAPDVARAAVRERLGDLGLAPEAERIASLLGLVAQPPAAPAPGAASPPTASPPTTSPALGSARTVLEAIARREGLLVAVFHELHWAEDPVLDFVQQLLRDSRAPVLVVCLARPEFLERRPDWSQPLGSALVPLEPLPRARAAEMLDALAPDLPPPVRESVLDRAGGNPFFLEELARLMDRAGGDVAVPHSVQALVSARLDALPPGTKRVLQDAAVIGEQLWPGALERLGAGEEIKAAIDSLVQAGLVEPWEPSAIAGEPAYRFRQALVREVAYGSVPKQVRAGQHLAVGLWLEEAAAARERTLYDLMAYHFERAATLARDVGTALPDADAKALDYLERAGQHALGMDAALTASAFFERALALATGDERRLWLRIRLAEALVGSWRHAQALQHLELALTEAERLRDRTAEATALRLLSDSRRMVGDFEGAREPLARALALATQIGDQAEEAEGLRSHGLLDLMEGRWSAAVGRFREALARYRSVADRRGEAWSLQNLGWANMLMGRLDDALDSLEQGETVFRELGDHEGAGWCVGLRAWVLLMQGEVMGAGRLAEELEHHLRFEHPEYLATAGFVLELQWILRAYVEVMRGHLGEAETLAGRAIEGMRRREGVGWVEALGRFPRVAAAIRRRRLGAARDELEAAERAAFAMGDPFYENLVLFARALLAFEEGRIDDAARGLDEVIGRGELGQIWDRAAGGRWLRASILRARGRLAEARAVLEERLGRTNVGLISTAGARVLLAEIRAETGDADGAIAEARAAAAEAGEELVARALALRAIARAELDRGDATAAERAAREELALLESSDWDVERVRALATLARALDGLGRYDESAEVVDRARAVIAGLPPGTDASPLEALLLR